MIQLIININDLGEGQVEISSEVEGDIDAVPEVEVMALDEILDCIDDMVDVVNEEDAKETTKDILSKIGKHD